MKKKSSPSSLISHISYLFSPSPITYYLLPITYFSIPHITLAAPFKGVSDLLTGFGGLVKSAIPITFALSILFFFYGIARYILHADDEKAAKEGKSIMIYGVIAIFVISSIFGLVKFIGTTIGLDGDPCGTIDPKADPC